MPTAGFVLAFLAVTLGPVGGFVTVHTLRRDHAARLRLLYAGAGAVIVTVIVGYVAGIRTASVMSDLGCCLAAVLAYGLLAAGAWTIRPRALGVAAGLLAHALFVPFLVLLAWAPTAFGLTFAFADAFAPPIDAEEISPTLSCRVWDLGGFAVGPVKVSVYRHPPFVPLVMVEAAHVVFDVTEATERPRSAATCASVAATLTQR